MFDASRLLPLKTSVEKIRHGVPHVPNQHDTRFHEDCFATDFQPLNRALAFILAFPPCLFRYMFDLV